MFILAPFLASVAAPLPPAQQQLTTCYISNIHRLVASKEPATVIADTVIALCSHLENDARLEIIEETTQAIMQNGTMNYPEAKRVVLSIEVKSAAEWRYRFRGLIFSQIMQIRQKNSK